MKRLVIVGARNAVILKLINAINREREQFEIAGYLDDDDELQAKEIRGARVLGKIDRETVARVAGSCVFVSNIYGGRIETRLRICHILDGIGVQYATLVHPLVDTTSVGIGKDSIVYQGVLMATGIEIGNHCILSQGVTVGHDCRIRDGCFLGPGAVLAGRTLLHEGVTVGSGAVIIGDLEIGERSLVGAGSVVVENVPPSVTVFGNPARIIKRGTHGRRAF
jgi:sugar O-acyltransferase (sialic acid O-acetyltransferase NeuD family)